MKKYQYDYSILIGKIISKVGSRKKMAELMECNYATLSRKLHNKSKFTQEDIEKICEILEENIESIPILFYTKKVRQNRTLY